MKRLIGALCCCAALLWGSGDANVTAAAASHAVQAPAVDVAALEKELGEIDARLKSQNGVWKKALDAYIRLHQLQAHLVTVEQELEKAVSASDAEAKKRLEAKKRRIESQMKRIDTERVHAVLYYVQPRNETLSINDEMYRRYETRAEELMRLRKLLQQRKKILRELMDSGRTAPQTQEALQKTTLTLDTIEKILERIRHLSDARLTKVNELNKQLAELKDDLDSNNIWQKSYTAYLTYLDVKNELASLEAQIAKLQSSKKKASQSAEELDTLLSKQRVLADQLALLQSHGSSPFADLLKPEEITEVPEITNPLDIFSGFSFNKKVNGQLRDYVRRGEELKGYLQMLLKQRDLLSRLAEIDAVDNYRKKIEHLDQMIDKYQAAYATMQDTANVYAKRVEEIELKINKAIQDQLYKMANIGSIILFLLIFFFIMKQIAKKYISDNERFYMANKIITFVNVTLIFLVLLFNYIENVGYVVTVLGFASAGIAIAMKDWFMSMLGWLVIVFGGSIHVGDRIRVDMNGMRYVGDVLDISLLRITILEDITLTSYTHNRRAGRIIFIPNNYIFTHMIANYTHVSLKTVWDGIDITVTFDSNHKKAAHIAKEITRKYAKGYTDITRNQLNKLRSRYNLKNTNVDPRIYSFVEENGIRISSWYLTNAYATLTLRSTISMEIIDAYGKEDDITIAYPTQRLRLQQEPLPQPKFSGEEGEPV